MHSENNSDRVIVRHQCFGFKTGFLFFRSASTARLEPSQYVDSEKLICVICGKKTLNRIRKNTAYPKTNGPPISANILMDNVYRRIRDIDTNERMFSADIY